MEEEKEKRKKWSKEETLLLLRCYAARKDEFTHSRKKKFAFVHVLEDMVSERSDGSNVTATTLDAKIRTLLSAYKSAKDNNRRTGASPCFGPYSTEMDEIFGDKPIICNPHTTNLHGKPITPLPEQPHVGVDSLLDDDIPSTCRAAASPISPISTSGETNFFSSSPLPSMSNDVSFSPPSPSGLLSGSIASSAVLQPLEDAPSRTRKSAKDRYREAKLKLAEKKLEQDRMFQNDLKQMLLTKWKKQEEIEEKKLKLLERAFPPYNF